MDRIKKLDEKIRSNIGKVGNGELESQLTGLKKNLDLNKDNRAARRRFGPPGPESPRRGRFEPPGVKV
jgi:hypothetical protein